MQIAGLVARRIVCDARVGDKIDIGATYGLIRYGSRLDTYLRPDQGAGLGRPARRRRRDRDCRVAVKPRIHPGQATRLLPSAMTVAAICFGLSAVKFALDGRYTESMAFLAVAAILDALDGRMARLLKATSKMGEEIDSLADAVNFGVAPALIVYAALLPEARIGWIVVLLYAVCIVLRLARYNAMLTGEQPEYEKQFFTGMPPRPGPSAPSARWPPRCSSATAGGPRRSRCRSG